MTRKTVAFLLWLVTLLPVGVFQLSNLALFATEFNNEAQYLIALGSTIAGLIANLYGYRMKRFAGDKNSTWFWTWLAIGFVLSISQIPIHDWSKVIIAPVLYFGLILTHCATWQLFKRLPGDFPLLDERTAT